MTKKALLILGMAAMLATACKNPADSGKAPELQNGIDTLSWVMGENIGLSIADGMPFPLNKEIFLQAIDYTIDGKQQPISDTLYDQLIGFIMQSTIAMKQKQAGDMRAKTDSLQQLYFAKLEKENPNVKKHPSGFYYEVMRQGHGPNAKMAQRIRFDYRSYLLFTGEPYDQTYGNREPIIHVVGSPMMPGLIDAFLLMNAGSQYRFYFPYQLMTGEKNSSSIQAFTPMIYEIELHELFKD